MRSGPWAAAFGTAIASVIAIAPAAADETPKHGGILTYMIPADAPPSFDGHRETTYATVHSTAPFYSVLIRLDPEHPEDVTKFVCDLCTEMPKPTDNGTTYTFKILPGVKWHDGSPLTAADVAASWNHIIHPPAGYNSARANWYQMVDTVSAPDLSTVVFHLKFATLTFLPALADPYTYIYKQEILDKDPNWYQKNIMGSGPFKFVEYQLGQSIRGERNPDYYHKGLPYLDGFIGIYADKQVVRTEAMRGDRATTEFRGLPPSAIDQLKKELGDKVTIQTSDWNCGNLITPNSKKKPFDDVRVRKALLLGVDQWHGAPALSKIANVRTVGGIVFPGSPLAATKEELQSMAGFWPDIDKSRAEAKRLLKEAGQENLSFEMLNRNVDQPYKYCRHLAGGRVVQDRREGHAEGGSHRPVVRGDALRQLRRRGGGQLQRCGQPGDGHAEVSAEEGVRGELRRLRGSGPDRHLREDVSRDRPGEAAASDARLRDARGRYDGV